MERQPVVAGQFYPGTKAGLAEDVRTFLDHPTSPQRAVAAIVPHAGYVYSGAIAGSVFARVDVPKRCIVLSPNHTGAGARAAVWCRGKWVLPTGSVPVDEALAEALIERCPELTRDFAAHLAEHSLEVELPFLLARQPGLAIVPIALSRLRPSAWRAIGEAVADIISQETDPILIVASTDMNHYEDQARTLAKDRLAIDRVLALDAAGLLTTCTEHRITMCGVIPTAVAIVASTRLGATQATLVEHRTSGDANGDYSAVVGYAGFIIA